MIATASRTTTLRSTTARLAMACAVSLAAIAAAACSSGGAGLTTGALMAKPKTDDATDRSLMVAATSARAAKCGYNYDPTKLRATYLGYESAQGAAPDALARLERSYDFARDAVIKSMAGNEDYCNEAKTAEIKRDLTRHLAGNFDLPPRKAGSVQNTWWGGSPNSLPPMDRDKIFNPLPTK